MVIKTKEQLDKMFKPSDYIFPRYINGKKFNKIGRIPEKKYFETGEAVYGLEEREVSSDKGFEYKCPKCNGTGYSVLSYDVLEDEEGIRTYLPFKASCSQCWGWGWVYEVDAHCIHDFKEIEPDEPWRCWHTIQCTKCGRKRSYSSD